MKQRDNALRKEKAPLLWRGTNLEKAICIIGLALVALFLCWQAIYRYAITQYTEGGGGAAWAEEGARYLFVAISYMAIPIAIRRRSLIRVDMLVNMFPEKLKGLSWVTADLACLILALIELYTCSQQWLMFYNYNSAVGAYGIPMIIPYAVVPISFLFISVRLIQDIADEVKKSGIFVLFAGVAIAVVLMLPILLKVKFSAAACLFLYFGIFVILGVPIAFALGLAGVCCIFSTGTLTIGYLGQLAFSSIGNSSAIICVPLFILAGNFMGEGGLSSRLFDILDEVLGGIHGGMAIATVGTCMIFAAMSGSGPATVAAVGSLTIPAMVKRGYSLEFSAVVVACAGAIGVLIPPSNPLVIFGISGGVSIAKLFAGGIVPGVLVGLALMIVCYVWSRKENWRGEQKKRDWKHIAKLVWNAKWALLVPVIILGGIYSGLCTPTEAAAIATVYGLIIGAFVHKEIHRDNLITCLEEAAATSSTCISLIAFATIFGNIMTLERIPYEVAEFITNISSNRIIILLIINILLLLVGMFMDTLAAIIILTPILLPVVTEVGVDPLHFGVLMVVNLAIGFVTPPVGVNLFVASGISNVRLEDLVKKILPLLGAMLLVLMLVTYIPQLTLFLPSIVAGG